jgi:hypothetical protein
MLSVFADARQLLKWTPAWLNAASSRMKSSWSILLARDSAKSVRASTPSTVAFTSDRAALSVAFTPAAEVGSACT